MRPPLPICSAPTVSKVVTMSRITASGRCNGGKAGSRCSSVVIERDGTVDGLRFITKNLLAILEAENRSIDWDMQDLVVPLSEPAAVRAGDVLRIRFRYDAGDSLLALAESIDGA